MEMEKILVSSCLLGVPCRWHGKKLRISPTIKRFLEKNTGIELIAVCPEMLGGLTCPRPPIKRKRGRAFFTSPEKELRKETTGDEVTRFLEKGAKIVLQMAVKEDIKRAFLCKWSPSCDKSGFTGKLLAANGIDIINTW